MRSGQRSGASAAVAMLLCVALGVAVLGDTVELVSGEAIEGTVARVIPGLSVDLLIHDDDAGTVLLRSYGLDRVARIELVGLDRMPDTLVAITGDQMMGTLQGSPLDDPIRFADPSGEIFEFPADNVSEIRFGPRAITESTRIELVPSFGLGVSLAANGIGIRRDAIAWFSEDWMLLASLGMHGWWRDGDFLFGVANEVTYMLDVGGWYLGLGSGAMFDFTNLDWYALLNLRTAFPVTFMGKTSMISLGVTLVW